VGYAEPDDAITLTAVSSPLEPDRQTRDALAAEVLAYLNDWYDRAGTLPVGGDRADLESLSNLAGPPAEDGRDIGSILSDLTVAARGGINHLSGGHMSYIPNSGMYAAALGELLAAGLNRYTGLVEPAPGFSAIEHGVIAWFRSLFEMGPESSGLLLSGGSMANFTGIVTARTVKLGDDFANGVMYVTAHTHHSAAKAARLAGIRETQIVPIGVDPDLRMNVEALKAQVRADRVNGREPFLIAASAGSTDTGAVDPLEEIAEIAATEGIWLHVDAAYGGFFQLTARGHRTLRGIEKADSVALDPHKGLSIPFGVGALIVQDEKSLVDAHGGRGAYLFYEEGHMGFRDIASLGPELSRPFRGLAVWLPLQLHGVSPFRDALDSSLDLAEHAYERLSNIEGIDARWKPDLSVVAVMFDDDRAGQAALDAVNEDFTVHLSPTIIDERFVLRFAILNRRSTIEHVDHAIDIIEKTLIG
jgi:aromatic-L-amino-acid decarboxylase